MRLIRRCLSRIPLRIYPLGKAFVRPVEATGEGAIAQVHSSTIGHLTSVIKNHRGYFFLRQNQTQSAFGVVVASRDLTVL